MSVKTVAPKSARESATERRTRLGKESVSAKAQTPTIVKASVPALGETRTTPARLAFAKAVVATREPKSGAKLAWSEVATDKKLLGLARAAGIEGPLTGSVLRRAYYVGGGKRRSDR